MSNQFNTPNQEYYPAESHDTMLAFTIGAILIGILFTIGLMGSAVSSIGETGDWYILFAMALVPLLVVIGGIYTLKVTKGFKYWKHGITPAERAIGSIVVIIGFLATFWLVIFILFAIAAARSDRK